MVSFYNITFIYPMHKFIHYIALFHYKKSIYPFKFNKFTFVPIFNMHLKYGIPKRRYIIALLHHLSSSILT